MNFKRLLLATLVAVSVNALAAEISVGTMSGKEADLLVAAKKIAKEKFDLDVKIVEFDDYVTPNIALNDGDIDLNAFQHRPYLNRMVNDRGFKLVAVADTFVYPIGAYSKKYKSLDDLPEGASVAIPNDPSNGGRTLILLAKKGLIELEDINNLEASVLDISKNPKKIDFKEIDAAQLPRMLDEVDVAFINSNYAVDAGLLPTKDAIAREESDSPYVNIIAAREDNKDDEAVKQFIKAYQTDAVKAAAEKAFKGAAVAGW